MEWLQRVSMKKLWEGWNYSVFLILVVFTWNYSCVKTHRTISQKSILLYVNLKIKKMKAEINKLGNKSLRSNKQWNQKQVLGKIYKKPTSQLTKQNKKKLQICKIRNDKGEILSNRSLKNEISSYNSLKIKFKI